jgi:GntR family transcriptional regulator
MSRLRELGEKVAENGLAAEPVFALLEIKYNTPLIEVEYKLEAAAADSVAAQALQVSAGSPIFAYRAHVVYHGQPGSRL